MKKEEDIIQILNKLKEDYDNKIPLPLFYREVIKSGVYSTKQSVQKALHILASRNRIKLDTYWRITVID